LRGFADASDTSGAALGLLSGVNIGWMSSARACSMLTISRPSGSSDTGITFRSAKPSGIPIMVRQRSTPDMRCEREPPAAEPGIVPVRAGSGQRLLERNQAILDRPEVDLGYRLLITELCR
jgi:hypothetical protein